MTGATARLAVPLGLLSDAKGCARSRNALLDEPTEEWDREERRSLMAFVMTIDVMCTTTSAWLRAIPAEELVRPSECGVAAFLSLLINVYSRGNCHARVKRLSKE